MSSLWRCLQVWIHKLSNLKFSLKLIELNPLERQLGTNISLNHCNQSTKSTFILSILLSFIFISSSYPLLYTYLFIWLDQKLYCSELCFLSLINCSPISDKLYQPAVSYPPSHAFLFFCELNTLPLPFGRNDDPQLVQDFHSKASQTTHTTGVVHHACDVPPWREVTLCVPATGCRGALPDKKLRLAPLPPAGKRLVWVEHWRCLYVAKIVHFPLGVAPNTPTPYPHVMLLHIEADQGARVGREKRMGCVTKKHVFFCMASGAQTESG
jgi:hypothetical protein